MRKIKVPHINVSAAVESIQYVASFSFLLTVYLVATGIRSISRVPMIGQRLGSAFGPRLNVLYKRLIAPTHRSEKTINRLNLIELAIRNMAYKKTRSIITIGGMSVGIAAIVFLVSIGFGLQQLVVQRVARLDELRQADVSILTGSKLDINDKTINDIKNIPNVKDVQPLVTVVGRVSFNDSISDVAVYGVTSEYLKSSAIKPVKGRIFKNNDLRVSLPKDAEVRGVDTKRIQAEFGSKIQDVDFVIEQEVWLPVRQNPTSKSRLLGYTRRIPGTQIGEEYWGDSYASEDGGGMAGVTQDGESMGKWVKSTFRLWSNEICLMSESEDCEENQHLAQRENGQYVEAQGFIIEKNMSVREAYARDEIGASVLGETSDGTKLAQSTNPAHASSSASTSTSTTTNNISDLNLDASSSALLEAEGINASGDTTAEKVKEIKLSNRAIKETIVNRAMLNILGLDEDEAIGKTFEVSFVVVGNLTDEDEKVQSAPAAYTIVGVDPESQTPFFYVPFIDLRSLGVTKYSQLKVVSMSEEALANIRQQVEVSGYATSSVVDTVERITSFFSTLRIVLALLGGVALAVASLGMFNTLTVSLLERTREVGLMKAMGMKSYEVKELFLTESMIMGFFGGLFGILLGVGLGYLVSFLLTVFALSKGSGVIVISHTPFIFIALTMIFSLLVGLVTGIYPARRATKISALNALRYE